MLSFSEQLSAVRKKRRITQEHLANEMNVSRPTISHWENGRAIPDIDTIKHLSQVLNYNFLEVEGMEGESIGSVGREANLEKPASEAMETDLSSKKKGLLGKYRFFFLSLLGVLLICAAILGLQNNKGNGDVQNTNMIAEQQAYVAITPDQNPVLLSYGAFEDEPGWMYELCFEETAGVAFIAEKMTQILYCNDGTEAVFTYSPEQLAQSWGREILTPYAPRYWRGGFPEQDVNAVLLTLYGADENGKQLEFSCYIDLIHEMEK